MSSEKILIIEDEEPISELIKLTLESGGFSNIITAFDGETGLAAARAQLPDLILLDLMLPGIDGLSVCRRLKHDDTTKNIPVIMLTAKSEESDIVVGLELGASDYIVKPFSRSILIARIRAQLRKFTESGNSDEIRYNELLINRELHLVRLGEEHLELTFTEFEILALFASHPGRVYTRNQIVSKIKGDDYPVADRAIDVQIVNLRRKLGVFGANIETVRGVGYRMRQQAEY